jgi:5-methylcytosine-specific restriction endonuclease McrA
MIKSSFCPACQQESFVIDNLRQCCNAPYEDFDSEQIKVIVPKSFGRKCLSRQIKEKIVTGQSGKCFYCERDFGYHYQKGGHVYKSTIHFDHSIPFVYSGNSKENNLVAACNLCNLIKKDRMFDDIEALRGYLNGRLKAKGIEIDEV